MTMLTYIYRNGLWIAAPAFLISTIFLSIFILNLVRLARQAPILRIPILEQQDIEFAEAGPLVLSIEGPILTGRFRKLSYELSQGFGTPVDGRTTWFHARTSGLRKVRMAIRSYEIPEPGRYILRINGLEAGQENDADHRLVFTRPHLFRIFGNVIGIILSAGLSIGSIVLFCLRLTDNWAK